MGFDFNPMFWFVCQVCRQAFPNTDDLKRHKLENHLGDCLRIKCVIFEETQLDHEWTSTTYYDPNGSTFNAKYNENTIKALLSIQVDGVPNPHVHLKRLTPQEINWAHKLETNINKTRKSKSMQGKKRERSRSNSNLKGSMNKKSKMCNIQIYSKPVSKNSHKLITTTVPKDESDNNEFFNDASSTVKAEGGEFIGVSISMDETGHNRLESRNLNLNSSASCLTSSVIETLLGSQSKNKSDGGFSSEGEINDDDDFLADPCHIVHEEEVEAVLSELSPRASISPDQDPRLLAKMVPATIEPESESTIYSEINHKNVIEEKEFPHTKTRSSSTKKFLKNLVSDYQAHLELSLREWLDLQKEKNPTNIILLDPDPTIFNETGEIVEVSPSHPVKCKLCQITFKSDLRLRIHAVKCWKLNKSKHRFCHLCNESFDHRQNLKDHNLEKHPSNNKCKECNKKFRTRKGLLSHIIVHREPESEPKTPRINHICSICNEGFQFKRKFQKHIVIHGERPFKCEFEYCSEAFKTRMPLARHRILKHSEEVGTQPFLCPASSCGRNFGAEQNLKIHIYRHHRELCQLPKPYECTICLQNFPFKHFLAQHNMVLHSQEKPFKCKECPAAFKCMKTFQRHQVIHGAETKYKCQFCQRSFNTKTQCEGHERTHTGDKPFKCQFENCDKSFFSNRALKGHTTINHGKELGLEQFLCSFCGKSFAQQCLLNLHVRLIHSDEKHIQCEWEGCEFKCNRKIKLVEHVRIEHTGERPYQCDTCGKDFARSSVFRAHKQFHDGTAPSLTCNLCQRKFQGAAPLKIHLEEHNKNSFPCQLCELVFTTKGYLKKHERIHEKEENEAADLSIDV